MKTEETDQGHTEQIEAPLARILVELNKCTTFKTLLLIELTPNDPDPRDQITIEENSAFRILLNMFIVEFFNGYEIDEQLWLEECLKDALSNVLNKYRYEAREVRELAEKLIKERELKQILENTTKPPTKPPTIKL